MNDGSELAQGCKKQSTKREMFSVGAPFEDTIGLPGLPGLWILVEGRILRSSEDGGVRKFLVCLSICPRVNIEFI